MKSATDLLLRSVPLLALLMVAGSSPLEAAEGSWGKAGYDKGFKFESADGNFTLKMSNRVQVRFTHEDPEEGDSEGSFRLRRYKFKLSGMVWEHWKYKLQASFAGQGDEEIEIDGTESIILEQDDVLEDAWFQYTKNEWVQPWMGQGKVFFGRQRLTSSGKLQFVDRAGLTDEAEVSRDIGVGLVGVGLEKKFEYNVGLYNGNGLNLTSNDNDEYAYAARLVWTPFGEYELEEGALDYPDEPKLALGGGMYQNTFTNDADEDLDVDVYGIEAAFKVNGFSAVAEYFDIESDLETEDGEIDSGYVQVGYLFPNKKFELAGRYAFSDPDDSTGSIEEVRTTGVAFSYYISKHDFKVQADIRDMEVREVDGEDETEARVQIQFSF